jgi:OmcA/MtrC family decaheme c-type cytochrome
MRIPPLAKTVLKLTALLAIVAVAVVTAGSKEFHWKASDKAYYMDSATVDFVRPGLVVTITSASIASSDGTMKARVTITDPKGLPLDKAGITTPGPVSLSCVMAVLPPDDTEFTAYTTRTAVSTINGNSAIQAATDSGGTWTQNAVGDYTYTFKTKAPSPFNAKATHRAGCQGSRDLSEFSLATAYSSAVLDFVPDGSAVTQVHDVVRTEACNNCHGDLAFHGGSRRGVEYCVMCHTKQTTDPDTGNTVDFRVMVHKIHMGKNLPSVIAGTPYQIIGHNNDVSDFSDVSLPSDPGRCVVCHDPKSGAAQANNYLTKPAQRPCGACHDDVNFASGKNHVGGPQMDDKQCANCHIPKGELPLDASIMGAHINTSALIPDEQDFVPGMIFDNLVVKNGTAGSAPTIQFTLKDKSGAPIPLSSLKASPGRLAAVLAGPATDYGYTSFGSDQTTGGYISEDVVNAGGNCDGSGNCSFTFKHSIPSAAKGTYSIGLEGRRGLTINAGLSTEVKTEYGAHNKVAYFSVDGSPVAQRRTVVSLTTCNACHSYLSLHGTNRDQIEMCVTCHNASETDKARRPMAQDPAEKAKPPQAVSFAYMIHHIHGGADIKAYTGVGYTVVGFGGSINDFSDVTFPMMDATGATGNIGKCTACHVNGSEGNLPEGLNAMTNPQGKWNPTPTTTAACTACHANDAALSHAYANTSQFGESCSVCHGPNSEFAVDKVHAQ